MKAYLKVTLLLLKKDQEQLSKVIEHCEKSYVLTPHIVFWDELSTFLEEAENSIIFLFLDEKNIKQFLKNNAHKKINVALLPHEDSHHALKRYGIQKDITKAFDDGMNQSLRIEDELLSCNEEISFKKISIGNVQNLSKNIELSLFQTIKNFINNVRQLKYQTIELKTPTKSFKKALSGILILEDYTIYSTLNTQEYISFHDGKLNVFLIAPYSLISYIYDLMIIFLYHRFSIGSLPKDIGFIATQSLEISSAKPFDFSIDDIVLSSHHIDIKITQSQLRIHYGEEFKAILEKKTTPNTQEVIEIQSLPKGDIEELLVDGNIPLFRKVCDEDIAETLSSLQESSKTTSVFIVLIILSTLLATVGLFQDSTPTVIGAMILAPLMAPIISLAMGFTRNNQHIVSNSLKTLAIGIITALACSALITLILPLELMTSQISSRIHPNLLDLFVAIFSGMAGAYASSKEEVAKSLAGVAIAVALVPPLAVTGIGIGWGELNIIYGSFLLFLTNFFGMILAASITFIVLGFAPIRKAKKGLTYSTVLLLIVSIPLVFSFYSLVLQSNDYKKLSQIKTLQIGKNIVILNVMNIKTSNTKKTSLDIEVISSHFLNPAHYEYIKQQIEETLNKEVELNISPKIHIQ
ncbi:MAG: TIGR00341 family protein [Arcobacteraceae bacterium]